MKNGSGEIEVQNDLSSKIPDGPYKTALDREKYEKSVMKRQQALDKKQNIEGNQP